MDGRRWGVMVAASLVALAVVGGARASQGAFGPPRGGPHLDAMPLAVTDFAPGVKVARQRYVKPFPRGGIVAEYDRHFAPPARLRGRQLLGAESDAILLRNARTA